MKDKFNSLIRLSIFIPVHQPTLFNPITCLLNRRLISNASLESTKTLTNKNDGEIEEEKFAANHQPKDSSEVLVNWGCTKNDMSLIFKRLPSLRNTDPISLNSKLNVLSEVGLDSAGLIKIVRWRPCILDCCIHHSFKERIHYLEELFGSREILGKAILRNPSLLLIDLHSKIKPAIELLGKMGVSKNDLVPLMISYMTLISYPTMISQSIFNEEKMSYLRKTGVSKDSKMYKYLVCIISVSRIETLREKIANFEKFGFQDDEVLQLFGRSPLLWPLSVEKVQRNMTFVLGTLKLSASVVLKYPFLLSSNLDTVLKPRVLVAKKIKDMGLQPQIMGPAMLRALRMNDDRFARAFILCHPEDVAKELMEYYTNAKRVKKLAASSKKSPLRRSSF